MTGTNKATLKKMVTWKNTFKDPKVKNLMKNKMWYEVDVFIMDISYFTPAAFEHVRGMTKDQAIEKFVRRMKRVYKLSF